MDKTKVIDQIKKLEKQIADNRQALRGLENALKSWEAAEEIWANVKNSHCSGSPAFLASLAAYTAAERLYRETTRKYMPRFVWPLD